MSLFPSARPAIRVRVLPRFPADVFGQDGITVDKDGMAYLFRFDPAQFAENPSPSLAGTDVLAVEGETVGRVRLGNLPVFVPDKSITYAKIQDVAAARLLGRADSDGTVEEIPLASTLAVDGGILRVAEDALAVFEGDAGSGGTKGLVPDPAAGDAARFLKGDATWSDPPVFIGAGGSAGRKGYVPAPALADAQRFLKGNGTWADPPVFTGDAGSGGKSGYVPAPAVGDGNRFLKGNGTWTTLPSVQFLTVKKAGTAIGSRPAINLIEGLGVGIKAVDDPAGSEVDVTIDTISMAESPPELEWRGYTQLGIKPGRCRDETNSINLINPTLLILNNPPGTAAFLHVLFGYNGAGSPSAMFSTTNSLPAGWLGYRRLGSLSMFMSLGTPEIHQFVQTGDDFHLNDGGSPPPLDIDTTAQGTTPILYTLNVPKGVPLVAWLRGRFSNAAATFHLVTDPVYPDVVPAPNAWPMANFFNAAGASDSQEIRVRTNAAGQVKIVSQRNNTTARFVTSGWTDRRGRDK